MKSISIKMREKVKYNNFHVRYGTHNNSKFSTLKRE